MPTYLLLILGNFGVVCGAFAIVGVLPAVQADLDLTGLQAGLLISVYAITYAVASPFLGWLATRFRYRAILAAAAAIAGVGAFVVAASDSFAMLLASRVAAAAGASMFTPSAAALAIAQSAPGREGRTLSIVALGIPLSQVLGLPLTALVGDAYGWRVAFVALGCLLLLVGFLLAFVVGSGRRPAPVTLGAFMATMFDPAVLRNVALTFIFSTVVNTVFTFQAQIFAERASLSANGIGAALFSVGVGTMAGTWLSGRSIDRLGPTRTLAWQAAATIAVVLPMTLLEYGLATACALGVLAGVALFNHIPPQQIRLMRLRPGAPGMLFAVNASFIYLGAAAGGTLSGAVVDMAGVTALGPVAGCGAGVALAYLAWLTRRPRQ